MIPQLNGAMRKTKNLLLSILLVVYILVGGFNPIEKLKKY